MLSCRSDGKCWSRVDSCFKMVDPGHEYRFKNYMETGITARDYPMSLYNIGPPVPLVQTLESATAVCECNDSECVHHKMKREEA